MKEVQFYDEKVGRKNLVPSKNLGRARFVSLKRQNAVYEHIKLVVLLSIKNNNIISASQFCNISKQKWFILLKEFNDYRLQDYSDSVV